MEGKLLILGLALILISIATIPIAHCAYHSETLPNVMKEKITNLHFFLFDILSGSKPSAVEVARANISKGDTSPTPFGSLFAIDDPIREGPEASSKVIGNAQGLFVSSSSQPGTLGLVMYVDFGFTTGKFNGSSFTVASRNPITEGERELAIVGGRGKFRMARGFAKLNTYFFNTTNGDAIIEYNVTLIHY
ncbi:dirigent protein 4 [Ziziphus jujuba]|uniref:Dirigent protein n=1 Tax=Ziziphus jujuba TaxID=326968 RepID=A0A6P4AAV7_ZIZJJ|nr:dirigent protein 4 [Ziziphus jujuba]